MEFITLHQLRDRWILIFFICSTLLFFAQLTLLDSPGWAQGLNKAFSPDFASANTSANRILLRGRMVSQTVKRSSLPEPWLRSVSHGGFQRWFRSSGGYQPAQGIIPQNIKSVLDLAKAPNPGIRSAKIDDPAAAAETRNTAVSRFYLSVLAEWNRDLPQAAAELRKAPDPGKGPEAPTIEALTVWSAVYDSRARMGQGRYKDARKLFQWASAYESRKPPFMDQGMAVRIPGLWARLGLAELELKQGNMRMAANYLRMFGHPSIMTPDMRNKLEKLRTAVESRGHKAGGDTYHDMLERMKRKNEQNN